MKKKPMGFTLLEIMITVVILAVLSALAIPAYKNTIEQTRSNEAITNLNIIWMAEKIYWSKNSSYWGPGSTTMSSVNSGLDTDMSATFYDTVNVSQSSNTYTAKLNRNTNSGGVAANYYQYVYTQGSASPPTCTKQIGGVNGTC